MRGKEQKYKVDIGFKNAEDLTAILCQKGVDELFADVESEKEFIGFYCCGGDKTLLRADEITFLFSKKIGEGKDNE